MLVMKFGGTSGKDAAAMSNIIRIVNAHLSQRPIVVISAIARATNQLEEVARIAARGDAETAETLLDSLFDRHNRIVGDLLTEPPRINDLRSVLAFYLAELKRLVHGVAILRELTPRTMDAFCSYGERLSSHIIAAGLNESGVNAQWIDARDFMLTDDNFGRAMPDMEEVTQRLERIARPIIEQGKVPVTQGFIGFTKTGVYTTMGRESSDFSASIIGAAMNAERVQIWTDVDGILTADPRMVSGVMKVKNMSFEEAFELSYFGAKVLHPNTMLPLLEKNIPVEIRNSTRTDGTGTRIERPPSGAPGGTCVKSIAFKTDVTVVTVSPRRRLNQYLFWEGIFSILSRRGITVGNISTSEYSIAFTLDGGEDPDSLKRELAEHGTVTIMADKGTICLVGNQLRSAAGLLNRIFDALADVNITMIACGPSGLNITVVVENTQVQHALGRLHTEFFGHAPLGEMFETPAH